MSEWTPGQTSINIRGAATEGQGRDFKSQVLVLINGHRAGTANTSKLSSADIERIEIVRGPSSVIYGSQNMGGVINIILKTGLTAPGNVVQADAGSWNLLEAKAATGGLYKGFDWYVGGAASTRDNYAISGGAPELNTAWTRYGATGAFGYQIDETSRIEGTVRSDGIYNAGFRGSSANLFAFDTRYSLRRPATSPRRATGRATSTSRPTSSPTSTISTILAAQRAQRRHGAHDDGSQPPPARHPRRALSAALQAVLRQRALVRPRLGAQLAAFRPLSPAARR